MNKEITENLDELIKQLAQKAGEKLEEGEDLSVDELTKMLKTLYEVRQQDDKIEQVKVTEQMKLEQEEKARERTAEIERERVAIEKEKAAQDRVLGTMKLEQEAANSERTAEIEKAKVQGSKADRIVSAVFSAIGVATTYTLFSKVLSFEETGVVKSFSGRGFLNSMFRKF